MHLSRKQTAQRFIAILLVAVTILGVFGTDKLITYADQSQTGMIYSTDKEGVETKKTAGGSEKANLLWYGKPVTVIETTTVSGVTWYKLSYMASGASTTGWAKASNVLLDSNAYITATGKINANNVSILDFVSYYDTCTLATVNSGHKVEILDSRLDGDSSTWYRVRFTSGSSTMIGWVAASRVTKDAVPDIETDGTYEDYLRSLGFPESYIKPLAVLHEQYPEWIFEPFHVGLDWNTVIENECYPGRSLVEKTVDDAKKSITAGDYDWTNNTWTIYDSSRWVQAHPDFIAYCMDPRNFLNSTNIFMFESLSYSSNHTLEGVKGILKGSFMEGTYTHSVGGSVNYPQTFFEVGQSTGVSPYHLASRVRQEQSATSSLISGSYSGYEGYYNYFNIGASGASSTAVIVNGLKKAKTEGWNTRYASILGGAKFLGNGYINKGQDTLYLQKFDVVQEGGLYWHQYMGNIEAHISESRMAANGYSDKHQPFVFRIPVYQNMPAEAVKFTASGNRNNYLKSLSVSGQSLTPTFKGDKTSYTLMVAANVSSINVSASPVVSKSTVTGTGTYNLAVGTNIINVHCKSQSGETKTYTLTVVRQGTSNANYTLTSGTYTAGTYITGVEPGTTASTLVSGLTCTGGTVKILNADFTENTGTVATGNKVGIYVDGTLVDWKDVVIYGDTNGDGKIAMGDLVKINRHILKLSNLTGPYLAAGDVNKKGDGITMSDLVITNRHLLELTTITQK